MTIIYRTRGEIRYSELSCASCHRDNFVVSEDALDFYYESAPAQPYICPTCRRRHDPKATLYGEWHNGRRSFPVGRDARRLAAGRGTMTTDFDTNTTFGEKYDPAMEITNQADADAYFERCVAHTMVERPCGREEAERVERFNIGYWTGYYDSETAARVQRLFRCEHPFFSSSMVDVIICEADL